MSRQCCILFVGSAGCSITVADGKAIDFPFTAPEKIASAVNSALRAAGYRSSSIAIGVPSAWCLSASISTTDLPRNDSKAMLYRLEEHLPLSAESVIADFVATDKNSALGVCVRAELIVPLVNALEAAGTVVQGIFPTVLATAQGLTDSIAQSPCLLLAGDSGVSEPQLNVILLEANRPTHWSLLSATPQDFKLQLQLLSTELGFIPHIEAIDIEPDLTNKLVDACAQVINIQSQRGSSLAIKLADDVFKGKVKPWIQFRRDQLAMGDPIRQHRKWLNTALAAAVVFLLSLAFTFWIRAHRYHQIEQSNNSQMLAAFQQHFPGWETPVNVRAVVDSQYRRQTGAQALEPAAAHASALTTLHDVLLPMTTLDHWQAERMAFHENSFEISGKLQSYEQVDALSKVARTAGMTVAPAQTRKDPDGHWTFSLTGLRTTLQQ